MSWRFTHARDSLTPYAALSAIMSWMTPELALQTAPAIATARSRPCLFVTSDVRCSRTSASALAGMTAWSMPTSVSTVPASGRKAASVTRNSRNGNSENRK